MPENSRAAIRAGAHLEVVEIDLQLDAGGRPFLMHDDTLSRMTGHDADTGGASPDVIADLRLREGEGGPDAPLTLEAIPRLEDAFAALSSTDAIFDLDVKHARDIEAVAREVVRLGRQDLATLKVDVDQPGDIEALRALEDAHGIMVMAKTFLRGPADLDLVERMRDADVAAAEVWFADLAILEEACARARPSLRIGTYTLDPVHCCGLNDTRAGKDPDAVWGALAGAGVGQIMTDRARDFEAWRGLRRP